jgi:hypothetical protein
MNAIRTPTLTLAALLLTALAVLPHASSLARADATDDM